LQESSAYAQSSFLTEGDGGIMAKERHANMLAGVLSFNLRTTGIATPH
jgi:hypothetical protein